MVSGDVTGTGKRGDENSDGSVRVSRRLVAPRARGRNLPGVADRRRRAVADHRRPGGRGRLSAPTGCAALERDGGALDLPPQLRQRRPRHLDGAREQRQEIADPHAQHLGHARHAEPVGRGQKLGALLAEGRLAVPAGGKLAGRPGRAFRLGLGRRAISSSASTKSASSVRAIAGRPVSRRSRAARAVQQGQRQGPGVAVIPPSSRHPPRVVSRGVPFPWDTVPSVPRCPTDSGTLQKLAFLRVFRVSRGVPSHGVQLSRPTPLYRSGTVGHLPDLGHRKG